MKKSQLIKLVKEELKGYSKYAQDGTTKGGTTADFMKILTTIAKQPSPHELPDFSGELEKGRQTASVRRGNKILDKANPENVERILRGDDPIYEEGKLDKYVVFFYTNDDDHDWDVMATSEEDAIQKVKSGEVKGPYGQSLPRLARKFSAKKLG